MSVVVFLKVIKVIVNQTYSIGVPNNGGGPPSSYGGEPQFGNTNGSV